MKEVTPIVRSTDGPAHEEPAQRLHAPPHGNKQRVINGTEIYDHMTDLDEPEIRIKQAIEAFGYYAVIESNEVYDHAPVASFLIFSDGSLYGTDDEGGDLSEAKGFRGFIFVEGGADELSDEEIERLLEETKIEEG